jgi:shikimate kinase
MIDGMAVTTILLLGPKHSGKTSAGKALAARLQRYASAEFIDLDALIEAQTGKSPRALSTEGGAAAFHEAEARALHTALDEEARRDPALCWRIVATGGGLVDNETARAVLAAALKNAAGSVIAVFLEVSVETAWERVLRSAEADGELPPFLRTENPEAAHRRLHERRNAACAALARIRVDADGKTPEAVAAAIAAVIAEARVPPV